MHWPARHEGGMAVWAVPPVSSAPARSARPFGRRGSWTAIPPHCARLTHCLKQAPARLPARNEPQAAAAAAAAGSGGEPGRGAGACAGIRCHTPRGRLLCGAGGDRRPRRRGRPRASFFAHCACRRRRAGQHPGERGSSGRAARVQPPRPRRGVGEWACQTAVLFPLLHANAKLTAPACALQEAKASETKSQVPGEPVSLGTQASAAAEGPGAKQTQLPRGCSLAETCADALPARLLAPCVFYAGAGRGARPAAELCAAQRRARARLRLALLRTCAAPAAEPAAEQTHRQALRPCGADRWAPPTLAHPACRPALPAAPQTT